MTDKTIADKTIGALPEALELDDESLLLTEQQGEARHFKGKKLKDYARPEITVGTVETVSPGTQASASITGTGKNLRLNLKLPQGATGAVPNITAGTVEMLDAEAEPYIEITGTPENLVLNVGFPRGYSLRVWVADLEAADLDDPIPVSRIHTIDNPNPPKIENIFIYDWLVCTKDGALASIEGKQGSSVLTTKAMCYLDGYQEAQPIKKQASGEAIMLRDISPVTHKMKVTVDSDATVYATKANIIPFPYPSFAVGSPYTQNGVTATVQDDGGILLNGTATAASYFALCQIKWSDQSFNSNPNVASNPNFKTSYVKGRWEAAYDKGNGRTFVTIQKGAAFNNEVIYPMITSADYPDDMPFVTGATPNSVSEAAGYDASLYSFPSECFVFANKSGVSVNVEYNADYTDIIEAVNKQINLIVKQPSETQTPDKAGFYTLAGTVRTDLAGAYHTDLIALANYNHIESVSRLYNQGYILAFFDKRKQIMHDASVVGADPAIDYEIDMDIPEGAAYCALSHYASAGAVQPYIKLSFKVGEETVLSSLKGKVINVLGDSITSVDYTLPNWWQKIAERTGARFNNYGVSGTSIAVRSGRTDSFLERADQMDVNADAVFIMGGTNDSNALIGEWNSTDTTTFFGALNALFPKICEKFPGKPIIVATPIQSTATYPSIQLNAVALVEKVLNAYKADPTKQSDWWILQTRAECIKLKAAQYGLPCLDLFYTSGINGADSGKIYFRPNDTLHPSAYGQERLAVLIQAELEKHFH